MPVHQEGVIAAVGGQEQEAGGNQEDPAERVTGLAPGDQDPDTRARNADHYRHDPVAERRAELGQPEGSRLAAVIARDLRAPGNRRVRGLGGEFFVLVLGLAV
jgi:hypothetical protein